MRAWEVTKPGPIDSLPFRLDVGHLPADHPTVGSGSSCDRVENLQPPLRFHRR